MNIQPVNFFNKYNLTFNQKPANTFRQSLALTPPLKCDTVSFTGASIYDYDTNFDALCSRITKYKSFFSSPTNFNEKAGEKYKNLCNEIFPAGKLNSKYNYKNEFVLDDAHDNTVITNSRAAVLKEWINFLDNPYYKNMLGDYSGEEGTEVAKALETIKSSNSLKLIILNAVIKDLDTENKRIPPSLNPYALAQTVNDLEEIPRCDVANFSFTNEYRQHQIKLVLKRAADTSTRDVKERKAMIESFPCSSGSIKGVWIKIPSKSHNKAKFDINTKAVEIISHNNWCTKRDSYKGSACIEEGDFYVFLREEKKKHGYEPMIGMALTGNKILQIQRDKNDDILNYNMLPLIDFIVKEKGLEFDYQTRDDGIPAGRQIEITRRLKDKIEGTNITLETAIKNNDAESIFKYAGIGYTVNENGMLEIERYTPKIAVRHNQVPPILFHELGINEYELLSKVEKINGKAAFETSPMNVLPTNFLKFIKGPVTARKGQFDEACLGCYNTGNWHFKNNFRFKENV